MKKILFCIILIAGIQSLHFGNAEIRNLIAPCELFVYFHSFTNLIDVSKNLLSRFFGNNYAQMETQIRTDYKETYGIDIMDMRSIQNAGLDTEKPLAFVHVSKNSGYLLLPVSSKAKIEAHIKKFLDKTAKYRIIGNYLILSENENNIVLAKTTIESNPAFQLCQKRLNFNWDTPFVWIESRYLSEAASGIGVTDNIKVPYGFTALKINFEKMRIKAEIYTGILTNEQLEYIRRMNDVSAKQKYDILDYIWGNPAFIGRLYLNVPMLYRYYRMIDKVNILGVTGLVEELWVNYRISIERDIINNSDGRVKLVIEEMDTINEKYKLYGSLGMKDPALANTFIETLKSAILKTGNKLYSFDLFTKPFFHYKTEKYSIYYGMIENEFLFSTDKDVLISIVKNMFENKSGYIDKMPAFFKDSSKKNDKGFFLLIDVQSMFSNLKTGVMLSKDMLIGVKDIYVYGNPDSGEDAYGWLTSVDINFYK